MRKEPAVLLMLGALALAASAVDAYDRVTWILEVFPILLGVPLLIATRRRFPLTPLVYRLLFLHALILMLGGHYTYARVPLGFWVRDLLGLARNHYDRLGHFAQGFVPAILAREILLRRDAGAARRLALLPGDLRLPGFQRLLRIHRMGLRRARRRGRGRLPRHPGRSLGHPVGHVLRPARRPHRPAHPEPDARPRDRAAGEKTA